MHGESFSYFNELRSVSDNRTDEFLAGEHTRDETRRFLNNLLEMELYSVNCVTEDYILKKRLGVGMQMRLIMDGRDRSFKGSIDLGGFYIDGKTHSECVELIRQQSIHLLQHSLGYIDRWESYAAMFNALPRFKPKAALII